MSVPVLEVKGLNATRTGVLVLRNIDLRVEEGEIVALIGPNGAGKSTFFGSVMGIHRITAGTVELRGSQIQGLKTETISRSISLVPQEAAAFPFMTIAENLWVAKGASKKELKQDPIFESFPVLLEKQDQEACTLSGGQRQALALGIGLIRKTELLLLDEPLLGLDPIMVSRIIETIKRVSSEYSLSILVSEQSPRILEIADRVYVIEGGEIRMTGDGKMLREDERIRKVYLGMTL
jgi:branched-chain amino acid transport system ATP-binding protein